MASTPTVSSSWTGSRRSPGIWPSRVLPNTAERSNRPAFAFPALRRGRLWAQALGLWRLGLRINRPHVRPGPEAVDSVRGARPRRVGRGDLRPLQPRQEPGLLELLRYQRHGVLQGGVSQPLW